jgi:hypothetical protein
MMKMAYVASERKMNQFEEIALEFLKDVEPSRSSYAASQSTLTSQPALVPSSTTELSPCIYSSRIALYYADHLLHTKQFGACAEVYFIIFFILLFFLFFYFLKYNLMMVILFSYFFFIEKIYLLLFCY